MGSQDSPALFRSILEQMADAVIYADPSGAIGVWNTAAAALFGFSAAEALGSNLDLIIPDHLRGRHWPAFAAAMASGVLRLEGRPTVTRANHQSGRKLYVELTFALVKDAAGVARGAVAVARDATARLEKQRFAERSERVGDQ
jgi:PAS domain S-box-containing protein